MSGHGTHHTGSGGYQKDTKMEENASKWQIERDNESDIQEALAQGDKEADRKMAAQERSDPDFKPSEEDTE